ncbi:YbaB/EbfC family nucleoid-associated protein [Candidatus Uhrbacteria bacterium]|nr:YbaB/EbfC family nucleoid-associated protein [Candidatus Uhrbacteria bacterium]
MSVFSKLKQFKDLRDQAKKIEDTLSQERIEVEGARGLIKLTINGRQEIISLVIDPSLTGSRLEESLKQTFNDAVKRVQQMMAGKIKSGDLKLPQM